MSYDRNKMISLLYCIFQAEGYTWGTSLSSPTFKEIEKTIEELENSAEDVKGYAETGRIMIKYTKEAKEFEYFLKIR